MSLNDYHIKLFLNYMSTLFVPQHITTVFELKQKSCENVTNTVAEVLAIYLYNFKVGDFYVKLDNRETNSKSWHQRQG